MKRIKTQRVVEFDADEDDSQLNSFDATNTSSTALPDSARDLDTIGHDSLDMAVTPTTRFLEQPILLDVKDGMSPGSSRTLPGHVASRGARLGGNGSITDAQRCALVQDELIRVQYRSPNLIRVAIAGMIGAVVGVVLNSFNLHFRWQWWIGLVGWLYLRTLECLALPLIFASVTLCIAQLVRSSKGSIIMIRLALMFIVSTFLASGTGLLTGFAMSIVYSRKSAPPVELPSASVLLQCPNEQYMTLSPNMCDGKLMNDAAFLTVTNITGITLAPYIVNQNVTYSTQIVDFFSTVFQQNITEAFTSGSYLGIVVFAIFIGAGMVVSQDYPEIHENSNYMYHVLKQVDVVVEWLLNYVVVWIPLGTLDAMTFTVMTGTFLNSSFKESIYLPVTLLVALVLNFFLVICIGYWIFVRKNPFSFLFYLLPALIYLMASERTVATIPIMMRSIERSKQVSRTLAQFTVSLGTALSLCGTACYFSVSCMYMAYTSGLESQLTAGRVFVLFIVSALSSFGVPEDNGATLTYTATIWHTVFGSVPPNSFTFVVGVEWLMSRLRRLYNITVVVFVARVIAEQLDETPEDEEDRAMASTNRSNDAFYSI